MVELFVYDYATKYVQTNQKTQHVKITFTHKNKKKSTGNNEKPSIVCNRYVMVVLLFTF